MPDKFINESLSGKQNRKGVPVCDQKKRKVER